MYVCLRACVRVCVRADAPVSYNHMHTKQIRPYQSFKGLP